LLSSFFSRRERREEKPAEFKKISVVSLWGKNVSHRDHREKKDRRGHSVFLTLCVLCGEKMFPTEITEKKKTAEDTAFF
jgi:hypothetical protein